MSVEDWIPDFAFEDDEEPDEYNGYYQKEYITCVICDAKELYWRMVNKKWILFNRANQIHECPPVTSRGIIKNASHGKVSR